MIERYYTVHDVADLVGIHPETVRREAARGLLPFIRIGRDLRFAESAVQEWLDSKREAA